MTKGVMPIKPVDGEITENGGEYGAKRDNSNKTHAGVDYEVKGKKVRASLDGVVVRANLSHPKVPDGISYGYIIVLYHGKNENTGKHTYTLYAHLQKGSFSPEVKLGNTVKRGKKIAISGNTGGSAKNPIGYHLHFETIEAPGEIDMGTPGRVSYGDYRVNPMDFLKKPFSMEAEELTDDELDKLVQMISFKEKKGPKGSTVLGITVPSYEDFLKEIGRKTLCGSDNPPKVTLTIKNKIDKKVLMYFPMTVKVDGRTRPLRSRESYKIQVWA